MVEPKHKFEEDKQALRCSSYTAQTTASISYYNLYRSLKKNDQEVDSQASTL